MANGEWEGNDEFVCATCKEVFATEEELREHTAESHDDE